MTTNPVGPGPPVELQQSVGREAAVLEALPPLIGKNLDFGCLVTTNGVHYSDGGRGNSPGVWPSVTRCRFARESQRGKRGRVRKVLRHLKSS